MILDQALCSCSVTRTHNCSSCYESYELTSVACSQRNLKCPDSVLCLILEHPANLSNSKGKGEEVEDNDCVSTCCSCFHSDNSNIHRFASLARTLHWRFCLQRRHFNSPSPPLPLTPSLFHLPSATLPFHFHPLSSFLYRYPSTLSLELLIGVFSRLARNPSGFRGTTIRVSALLL